MSMRSKRARARRRKALRNSPEDAVLREFVATHIPDLATPDPWTPEQRKCLVLLHADYQLDPRWMCEGECGRVVNRLGDRCASCRLPDEDEQGPVTWEYIGVTS